VESTLLNSRAFILEDAMKKISLSFESEKAVVMGLIALKALGNALVCIGSTQISLDDDTLTALGDLIIDKAVEVYGALEGVVI
jgi:hypothetical protein